MVALSQEVILLEIDKSKQFFIITIWVNSAPNPTVFDGNPRFGRFLKNFIDFSYTCHRYKTVKL